MGWLRDEQSYARVREAVPPERREFRLLDLAEMEESEKGEVLLRGAGTLRYSFLLNASVQWQPDGLTIDIDKQFLGAGFLGAPPISLKELPPASRVFFISNIDGAQQFLEGPAYLRLRSTVSLDLYL